LQQQPWFTTAPIASLDAVCCGKPNAPEMVYTIPKWLVGFWHWLYPNGWYSRVLLIIDFPTFGSYPNLCRSAANGWHVHHLRQFSKNAAPVIPGQWANGC
jgi:hypothetical protein